MENKIKKGCVYFFKHIGLNPIKIGYSDNESPFDRFTQFKTYAPFGAEIIGFVICEKPYEVEQYLHEKYCIYRLEGEWFDVDINLIKNEIDNLTTKEQKDDFNDYLIKYAKYLKNKEENKTFEKFSFFKNDIFYNATVLNIKELIELDNNLTMKIIQNYCNENEISYKNYRIGNFQKKGYMVYLK